MTITSALLRTIMVLYAILVYFMATMSFKFISTFTVLVVSTISLLLLVKNCEIYIEKAEGIKNRPQDAKQ